MLRVHMSFPTAHGTYEDSAQVPLERLFRQFFLLLSDVLEQWPANASCRPIEGWTRPTVIMNGRCEILHASYAASSDIGAMVVPNRHHRLSMTELLWRGYRMGALFGTNPEYEPLGDLRGKYVRHSSIYGLWEDLLEVGWSNLYAVRKPG